jgi:hypothetical protein
MRMNTGRLSWRIVRLWLAAPLLVGVAASVSPLPATGTSAAPGTWVATGALSQARGFAPVVRLGDGSVITAGGTDGTSFSALAER